MVRLAPPYRPPSRRRSDTWYRWFMRGVEISKRYAGVTKHGPRGDEALLRAGHEALRTRLGTVGLLRYLVLVGGGRDRFQDARRTWADTPLADFEAWLRQTKGS